MDKRWVWCSRDRRICYKFSKNKLIDGLTSRVAAANSPNTKAVGRPEIEGEAVHIVTAGDVKLEKNLKKRFLYLNQMMK